MQLMEQHHPALGSGREEEEGKHWAASHGILQGPSRLLAAGIYFPGSLVPVALQGKSAVSGEMASD